MSNEQWESNSYYSDEESDDEYAPLQMSSWGATATENRDGTTTVDVSAEGWATLIDPSVKLKANGVGSGQLHRRGNNFKPVDESYIINRRLNLPVKGSGKKSRSGSSTPKSAPKKKTVKKSAPPPPKAERMVPPSSSAMRGRPPINPSASAWGSANLASTPFWEQQQQSSTGSAASKYATNTAPPRAQQPQRSQPPQAPQAPSPVQPMQSQWGQQTPQQVQHNAQQWGQNFQQQQQQQQPHQVPVQQQQPQLQQPQWGQPQQHQQPAQSQWAEAPLPQQQQQPQQHQQQHHHQQQQQQLQQQQQQQPQSQAYLSKYAHGSDASIYAPQTAPPPQPAPTVQSKAGTPCIKFNIQLGVGITAELSVYQNDSPEEVVNAFEKRHHLNMSDVAKANFAVKIRELLKQYTGQ